MSVVAVAEEVPVAQAAPDPEGPMAPDDDDEGAGGDTTEEKRLKRMRRNRESAAQSRNRKKQYVDSLESEIRQLKSTINNLTSDNFELRREHARLTGAPPPVAPEPVSMVAPVVEPIDDDGPAPQHPIAIAAHAVAHVTAIDPHCVTASATVSAPSPRKSDALLGLELLSRSASIGADNAEDNAHEGDAAEVMDAEATVANPVKEDEPNGSESGTATAAASSSAGSTASSMSLGARA